VLLWPWFKSTIVCNYITGRWDSDCPVQQGTEACPMTTRTVYACNHDHSSRDSSTSKEVSRLDHKAQRTITECRSIASSPMVSCAETGLFQCEFPDCGATFKRRYDISIHLRVHTNERPYACDIHGCGMAFKTTSACNAHKLTHSGSRPFGCTFPACGARFSQKSSCTRHYRLVHQKRPWGHGERVQTSDNPSKLQQ
jgi:uncharacterized Zn-finger protein